MNAESLYEPIPVEKIRQARARLAYDGDTVETWAKRNGFKPSAVYRVLGGKRMCIRGVGLRIAIKLGLRPHPDSPPAVQPGASPPVGNTGPSIAGLPPVASCDRRPVSQLGEAAR